MTNRDRQLSGKELCRGRVAPGGKLDGGIANRASEFLFETCVPGGAERDASWPEPTRSLEAVGGRCFHDVSSSRSASRPESLFLRPT